MRVLAPVLGPVWTADLRVLIAGIALLLYFRLIKFDLQWKIYWKQYLIIGAFNSAIPFVCFSFAALYIPASLSVILNSTSPFFAALFSAFWLGEKLSARRLAGIGLGALGVSLVVRMGVVEYGPMALAAMAACIAATICYGFSATYAKKFNAGAQPRAIAGASQLLAGILLLTALPFSPVRSEITPIIVIGVLVFAIFCSAIPYLLYYRLIVDLGPTRALTVTFLMPVFGMLWGALILDEAITWPMIVGTAIILVGTALVLKSHAANSPAAIADDSSGGTEK
jgi:drug/metabolite transporter (DMT)-like permease